MEQQKAAARISRPCGWLLGLAELLQPIYLIMCVSPGLHSQQMPPPLQKPSEQGLTLACTWVDKAAFHGSSRGSVTCSFHLEIYRAFDFNGFCRIGVLPPSFLAAFSEAGG